jgi:hypothetical protein
MEAERPVDEHQMTNKQSLKSFKLTLVILPFHRSASVAQHAYHEYVLRMI